MHNIFTFALLIILFIPWKREHIGGILLLAVGIFMIFFFGGPLNLMYGTWLLQMSFTIYSMFMRQVIKQRNKSGKVFCQYTLAQTSRINEKATNLIWTFRENKIKDDKSKGLYGWFFSFNSLL